MQLLTDLRAAILSLDHVPADTPVVFSVEYGNAPSITYDERMGLVHINVGIASTEARPTMGQLRAWVGLPQQIAERIRTAPALQGPAGAMLGGFWNSMRLNEPLTPRGILTFLSAVASGYHGVARNKGSIGWGLWWFFWGATVPGIVPMFALAQGFAEPQR